MRTLIAKPLAIALLSAGLSGAPAVQAHEAGDILLKVGVSHVKPKSSNGKVQDGAVKLDIGSNTRPTFSLTYMATRNIGIELLGGFPFQHNVDGSGGLGRIAQTKHLPPTLSLQWHFLPSGKIQPYAGIGVNYTHFFDTKTRGPLSGSKLKLSDSWGLAAQIGVDVPLNKKWFMNADLRYIDIESTVRLDGKRIGKTKIDPWVATLAVGYRF